MQICWVDSNLCTSETHNSRRYRLIFDGCTEKAAVSSNIQNREIGIQNIRFKNRNDTSEKVDIDNKNVFCHITKSTISYGIF